jgi:hypothetical protein
MIVYLIFFIAVPILTLPPPPPTNSTFWYPVCKENIWLKIEIGEYDDEKCHLICYLNCYGPLLNWSAVVCVCISELGAVGVKLVSFGTHKS